MKVFVYFNLHKKVFSVKALEGANKGRVVAHTDKLTLTDVTFKVSEAGRQRVLRERKKNVHAGVTGQWDGTLDAAIAAENDISVTYNPYVYDSFVLRDNEVPIHGASSAYLDNRKIFV
jgi:hypothetical protein